MALGFALCGKLRDVLLYRKMLVLHHPFRLQGGALTC